MSVPVRVLQAESVPLAVVRRRASPSELSTVVPRCCGEVWEFLRAQRVPAGRNVAVYLDSAIRIEVGVEVSGPFEEAGDVVRSATQAGAVAVATHLGPYPGLRGAHDAIHAWCAAHGERLAGPRWEIYGHWRPEWNADPSLIRTDVYYLLVPTDRAKR